MKKARSTSIPIVIVCTLIGCLFAGACGRRATTTVSEPPAPSADASVSGTQPDPRPPATSREPAPTPAVNPVLVECQTNDACPPDQFCFFPAGNCGQANGLGRCEPRGELSLCPDYDHCPEVCGCDGATYCDDCHARSEGVNVAYEGRCCVELATDYDAAVQGAKQCCAHCDEETCTVMVSASLPCGCDTMISAVPDWRVQQVARLQQQWVDQRCDERVDWDCPAVMCPAVVGGSCQPDGSSSAGGRCADAIAD